MQKRPPADAFRAAEIEVLVDHQTQRLLDKLADAGTPLDDYLEERGTGIYYGIKTGLNKAFVIKPSAYAEFERPKIMLPDIVSRANVTLDQMGDKYCVNTTYIIGADSKYLLAVLNSSVTTFYYEHISSACRGGYLRFNKQYLERIPIPEVTAGGARRLSARAERQLTLHPANSNPPVRTGRAGCRSRSGLLTGWFTRCTG